MKPTLIPYLLLFAAVTIFTLTFTSCGSDDDDKPAPSLNTPDLDNETFTISGVKFKMVGVKGGAFQMGSTDGEEDERPVHTVSLSSYWIGETEVTEELWAAVMGEALSTTTAQRPQGEKTWEEVQEFLEKLSEKTGLKFRLPTEAEWEFAARGGTKSKNYMFSGSNVIGDVAWYQGNSGISHDVGTKDSNELGIYDMSGNVYEFCQDWYGSYGSASQVNPTGPDSGTDRVVRGGFYGSYPKHCRPARRFKISPTRLAQYRLPPRPQYELTEAHNKCFYTNDHLQKRTLALYR